MSTEGADDHWLGTQPESANNRFRRLLRNPHIDEVTLVAQWANPLSRRRSNPLRIAVDGRTE